MARNAKNTRMCSGCMTRMDKEELISIYKSDEGILIGSNIPKVSGRSVYLCPKKECMEKSIKKKSFSRGLKCEIEPEFYYKLRDFFKSLDGE